MTKRNVPVVITARHEKQISALYKAIGIDTELLAVSLPETQSGVDELIIDVSYDSVFNVAQIEIINYGDTAQTLKEVHAHLRDYCIKKVDVIFLFLDMSKPLTAVLTERFEKMGFFFSGILPGGKLGKETLILQYLNNLYLDLDQLCFSSDEARELLLYIKENGFYNTE